MRYLHPDNLESVQRVLGKRVKPSAEPTRVSAVAAQLTQQAQAKEQAARVQQAFNG